MTYEDADIQRALTWLLGFMAPGEWERRKNAIETSLAVTLEPRTSRSDTSLAPVTIADDRIGWYLYLAETALTATYKYEPVQGARVLPIFKRLGARFDSLSKVRGLDERVRRLVHDDRSQPDSGLFELLVALLWLENDWPDVELLAPASSEKRPDISVTGKGERWFIECKRLAKSSLYSEQERMKWLAMWRYLERRLVDDHLPFVFDIIFHVELEKLSDDFIEKELSGKLQFLTGPGTIIDNETWTVGVNLADLSRARQHLRSYYVRCPSPQLSELIAGRREPSRGFTSAFLGQIVRMGEGRVNNQFLKTLDFAAGAFWHCDADRAIERKARDIRSHLAEAIEQLPYGEQLAVHVGLETLDGLQVEAERYLRIFDTAYSFDVKGKDLKVMYCHLFQSYAPPEEAWVIDETVYYFSTFLNEDWPLKQRATVIPHEMASPGVHWLRDAP